MFNEERFHHKLRVFRHIDPSHFDMVSDGIITTIRNVHLDFEEEYILPFETNNSIVAVRRLTNIQEAEFVFLTQNKVSLEIKLHKDYVQEIKKIEAYDGAYDRFYYKIHFEKNNTGYFFDVEDRVWKELRHNGSFLVGTQPQDLADITPEEWSRFYEDCRYIKIHPFVWSHTHNGLNDFGRFRVFCDLNESHLIDNTNMFIINKSEFSTTFKSLIKGKHEYQIIAQKSTKDSIRGRKSEK